jgi:hypothetical protein
MEKNVQPPHVLLNTPSQMLRKVTTKHPEGRTSHKVSKEIRSKVTVVGATAFKDPNAPHKFSEID